MDLDSGDCGGGFGGRGEVETVFVEAEAGGEDVVVADVGVAG